MWRSLTSSIVESRRERTPITPSVERSGKVQENPYYSSFVVPWWRESTSYPLFSTIFVPIKPADSGFVEYKYHLYKLRVGKPETPNTPRLPLPISPILIKRNIEIRTRANPGYLSVPKTKSNIPNTHWIIKQMHCRRCRSITAPLSR